MNKRQREKNQKNKLIETLTAFGDEKKWAISYASRLKRMARDLYQFHKKCGGKNEARRILRGNGLV